MKLTTEEKTLYQRHLSNLTGPGGVNNPDGSRSTLYEMTVGFGDRTYVLPRVWDGKILSVDQAISRAKQVGLNRFPSYGSAKEAEDRYSKLHDYMERDTDAFLHRK